jgi:hypothetical protein
MGRKVLIGLGGTLAAAVIFVSPGLALGDSPYVCAGTGENPGVLVGHHAGNVLVHGVCAVPAGPAEVHGTLTLGENSALIAAFGANDSSLTVDGSIRVEPGATMLLGCDPQSFPCIDDPNQAEPTLSSAPKVGGNITSLSPLGVVVHNATIRGSVTETGGGGGVSCEPRGIFAAFMSPVYSAYEDSTVGGGISIFDLHSCWLGVTRTSIGKSLWVVDNHLADPDAIEILSNHIADDLGCFRNTQNVWNSAEASFGQPGLWPRTPFPNTVLGARLGQCVLASPPTDGSPPGPGPF